MTRSQIVPTFVNRLTYGGLYGVPCDWLLIGPFRTTKQGMEMTMNLSCFPLLLTITSMHHPSSEYIKRCRFQSRSTYCSTSCRVACSKYRYNCVVLQYSAFVCIHCLITRRQQRPCLSSDAASRRTACFCDSPELTPQFTLPSTSSSVN